MSSRLEQLLAGELSLAAVQRFAAEHGMPLVDGDRVTFLFWGDAEQVHLRHWIFGMQTSVPLERVQNSDLWHCSMELPARSRVEYKLDVVRGGHGKWLLDPLNPQRAHDPFGANSVCHAEGYETPTWTRKHEGVRRGRFDSLLVDSSALGGKREVPIYLPARFHKESRYPLLIFHDGNDFLRYGALDVVLDNLIERLEIPSVVAVLCNPGDRLREYGADDRHATYLATELLPAVEAEVPLIKRRDARCVVGASFGAVASLHAAWRYPDVFGRLALMSGSFAFADIGHHHRSEVFDPVAAFVNELRAAPGQPAEKIYLCCGKYESLIHENRAMLPVLQRTCDVRYFESRDGHNWENWRDRMRDALSYLLPGPLWMVYE